MKLLSYLLVLICFLLIIPNFLATNIVEDKSGITRKEKFDPALVRLNSLSKLEAYVDSVAVTKNILDSPLAYAVEAEDIVSRRFYHKYATQDLKDNWIASVCQKLTGYYLSSKVTAEDILKKPYGYCGQQNAVLMELLLKKKFNYRVLYFPHHFVFQSYINNHWCYFDADQEPTIQPYQRTSEKWLNSTDSLSIAYNLNRTTAGNVFGTPGDYKFGKINEIQGKRVQIFQSITKVLSKIAFLLPLILVFYLERNKK